MDTSNSSSTATTPIPTLLLAQPSHALDPTASDDDTSSNDKSKGKSSTAAHRSLSSTTTYPFLKSLFHHSSTSSTASPTTANTVNTFDTANRIGTTTTATTLQGGRPLGPSKTLDMGSSTFNFTTSATSPVGSGGLLPSLIPHASPSPLPLA